MSIKRFGIYIAYPPTVDLRHEGLGRYLAAFLKGAAAQKDVSFTLVCPSWSRESLSDLLEAEGVPASSCQIVSPRGVPLALRTYEAWLRRKHRGKGSRLIPRMVSWLKHQRDAIAQRTLDRLVRAHSVPSFVLASSPLGALIVVALLTSPLLFPMVLMVLLAKVGKRMCRKALRLFRSPLQQIKQMASVPKDDRLVRRLYRAMEQTEVLRMQDLISPMTDIRAWYCPTAFWPAFNDIQAARLMCVPDVVLTDFPVGFAAIGGDRFLENFELVEKAIANGQHFVTYSAHVKWSTLVDRYGMKSNQVSVVHHAPNDLSKWITIKGFTSGDTVTRNFCQTHLTSALRRVQNNAYTRGFSNTELKFIFYASQMRPNKNVLSLLRAYQYLLRERLIGHKLILTGKLSILPEVKQFVIEHHLQNEVLFLHGLKIQELAACYHLADVAVNPSLSEGGCPFTFTEALSVGTPVVMARIPVTEEVLTDPVLQSATFFDPYDWRDMAERIEWALNHREELLAIQQPTYHRLAQRSWQHVVQEHIAVLDRIAKEAPIASTSQ